MTNQLRQQALEVISRSPHTIAASCKEVGIGRSSYYRWQRKLTGASPPCRPAWNRLRPEESEAILREALAQPSLSARELAYRLIDYAAVSVSESSVRRVLKARGLLLPRALELTPAAKEFRHKTHRPNELWGS